MAQTCFEYRRSWGSGLEAVGIVQNYSPRMHRRICRQRNQLQLQENHCEQEDDEAWWLVVSVQLRQGQKKFDEVFYFFVPRSFVRSCLRLAVRFALPSLNFHAKGPGDLLGKQLVGSSLKKKRNGGRLFSTGTCTRTGSLLACPRACVPANSTAMTKFSSSLHVLSIYPLSPLASK